MLRNPGRNQPDQSLESDGKSAGKFIKRIKEDRKIRKQGLVFVVLCMLTQEHHVLSKSN